MGQPLLPLHSPDEVDSVGGKARGTGVTRLISIQESQEGYYCCAANVTAAAPAAPVVVADGPDYWASRLRADCGIKKEMNKNRPQEGSKKLSRRINQD